MRAGAAGIRLAAGVAILSVVGVADPTLARNHVDMMLAGNLTVLLYDYAAVGTRTIAEAEKEAARVFERAGITLLWHNCGNGAGQAVSDAACGAAGDSAAIRMRLVKTVQNLSGMTDDATLGYAVGQMATVSWDMVRQISDGGNLEAEYVLGDAMAHELGHVLMPGRPHAVAGIMRAGWDDQDLSLMRKHGLNFLPAEIALIRASAERIGGANAAISTTSER